MSSTQTSLALLHERFESQAEARPRARAVECDGIRLSYRELNMKDQAKADFQTVIQKYPDSLFASLAKQQLEGIK